MTTKPAARYPSNSKSTKSDATRLKISFAMAESKPDCSSEKDVKAPNLIERAKEEIEAILHSPRHHKETHGRNDDIDEDTPVDEVKGPNVFQRVKEEIEAIVEAIHPKKESKDHGSS